MAETGLLAALSGRDNWDVVRSERQRELQLATLQSQMAKQDFQEQQLSAAEIADYLSTPGKIKVLDPAIQGIQDAEAEYRKPISEGIMKANGDVRKFLQTGGLTMLKKYQNNLVNDPLVAKGIMSAANYNRYITDKQAGLVPRGTAEEDIKKYMNSESDAFGYQGAYKRPDLTGGRDYFSKTPGKDPYTPQEVDPFAYHNYAEYEGVKSGLSPADSKHFADMATNDYVAMKKAGGQPYMFETKARPNPPAWWGNDRNALISARFTVDQLNAVADPAFNKWGAPKETYQSVTDPATGKEIRRQKVMTQEADMVPIPIGKRTVKYDEGKFDSKGKWSSKEVTKEIDDYVLPIMKINGRKFIRTEADRLQDKPGVEFTSNNINKIILATPKTPDGLRMIAAYRKVMKDLGVLDDAGVANFDLDNKSAGPQKGDERPVQGGTAIYDGAKWVMKP